MTKACRCLLAWSVSIKRIFIWLQIPAYLYYKHAAKTGTGCESFLWCKLELKSICSRNRPQHIGHGPNKQKTWFHLSCTRQKPDVNMKERKTTESNDPKKPLLIDTSLNGEFLEETWWKLGMGGKAFPPRSPAAVVVGMSCLHSPSVCTPQPTTITKSLYCFHWNTTTYMYKKSEPTSFSSVLIIKLSIKHQHQDIFSRTSSALAHSTQLAAGSKNGLQHTQNE